MTNTNTTTLKKKSWGYYYRNVAIKRQVVGRESTMGRSGVYFSVNILGRRFSRLADAQAAIDSYKGGR